MTRPDVIATALQLVAELPSGTEFSASDLQRETAFRLRRDCASMGHSMPFRILAQQLIRLGRLKLRGRGLYAKV